MLSQPAKRDLSSATTVESTGQTCEKMIRGISHWHWVTCAECPWMLKEIEFVTSNERGRRVSDICRTLARYSHGVECILLVVVMTGSLQSWSRMYLVSRRNGWLCGRRRLEIVQIFWSSLWQAQWSLLSKESVFLVRHNVRRRVILQWPAPFLLQWRAPCSFTMSGAVFFYNGRRRVLLYRNVSSSLYLLTFKYLSSLTQRLSWKYVYIIILLFIITTSVMDSTIFSLSSITVHGTFSKIYVYSELHLTTD